MHILITGATLAGVSAACALARKGHQVTLTDPHAFAGGDVVAALHTYTRRSRGANRLLQPNGQLKMELYAHLMDAGVRLLLCSRVCGLLSDREKPEKPEELHGVVLATKYGLMEARADLVLDATEEGLLSSVLTGETPDAIEAEYGYDLADTSGCLQEALPMPEAFGLVDHCVTTTDTVRPMTMHIGFRFPLDAFRTSASAPEAAGRLMLEDAAVRTRIEQHAHQLMLLTANELHQNPKMEKSTIEVVASHTRLIYTAPVRHPAIPAVDAALPVDFTLEDRRILEENAAASALAIVSALDGRSCAACVPDSDLLWISFGRVLQQGLTEESNQLSQYRRELKELGLRRIHADPANLTLPERKTTVLTAGVGTGGAMSAWALTRHQVDALFIDQFYFFGGTNTIGRVSGSWHGYVAGMYKRRFEEAAQQPDSACMNSRVRTMMFWERTLGEHFLGGLTLCGVRKKDSKVESVLVCGAYGLEILKADYLIDGTADGDVCAFSGVPSVTGGTRDGNVQNSSMWGYEYNLASTLGANRYNSDEDEIDPNSYADYLRGIGLGYLRNSFYEITEMCMQRESRRFACRKGLTMAAIARRDCPEDTISVGLCTHDSHGAPSSLMNRHGFFAPNMLETETIDIRIRMPWGMFLPQGLSNTAIVGKSMCGEREAVSLCRMNPDVSNAGYAVGTAVAYAVKQQAASLDAVDLKEVQQELRSLEVLPEWYDHADKPLGVTEALEALSDPADHGFSSMVQPKEAIVPHLLKALDEGGLRAENAARALAWHGCPEGASCLKTLLRQEMPKDIVRFRSAYDYAVIGIRADGFEKQANVLNNYAYVAVPVDDEDLSYMRVCQLLVLLGLSGADDAESIEAILNAAENFDPGELLEGRTCYAHSRIDGWKLMGDERLWSLVHAAERLAAPALAPMLEKFMDYPAFCGIFTEKGDYGSVSAPRMVQLAIALAAAAARCSSRRGAASLIHYLEDARSVFSGMARKYLVEIFGADAVRDDDSAEEWAAYLAALDTLPAKPYRGSPFEG